MTVGRKAKITKLNRRQRGRVDQSLADGKTIDDVTERLQRDGADLSRSSVGRYAKNWRAMAARLSYTREASNALAKALLPTGDTDSEKVLTQLLEGFTMQVLDKAEAFDPKELQTMSRAIANIVRTKQNLQQIERNALDSGKEVAEGMVALMPEAAKDAETWMKAYGPKPAR